jgi:hypothetical protein
VSEFKELASKGSKEERENDFVSAGSCQDCGRPAAITLFEVMNRYTGQVEQGPASEYSQYSTNNNPTWIARPGYSVISSRGWCAYCWLGVEPSGDPAEPKIVKAWKWLIEQWDHDKPNLSVNGADDFLELCNQQSRKNRNPEAIPPHCWLDHVWGCTRDEAIERTPA